MDAIETEDPAQVANNGDESPDSTSSASEGSIPGGSSNNVFSSSRPRDIGDGMSKGLGNVFKGVLGGVAMMVASPVAVRKPLSLSTFNGRDIRGLRLYIVA